ncbi:MAG: hypothetical protein M1817_002074 [Caeruleum heppii]|nr:MAG: hypothetical protein M1817_002074 [Caeruleum heppii]
MFTSSLRVGAVIATLLTAVVATPLNLQIFRNNVCFSSQQVVRIFITEQIIRIPVNVTTFVRSNTVLVLDGGIRININNAPVQFITNFFRSSTVTATTTSTTTFTPLNSASQAALASAFAAQGFPTQSLGFGGSSGNGVNVQVVNGVTLVNGVPASTDVAFSNGVPVATGVPVVNGVAVPSVGAASSSGASSAGAASSAGPGSPTTSAAAAGSSNAPAASSSGPPLTSDFFLAISVPTGSAAPVVRRQAQPSSQPSSGAVVAESGTATDDCNQAPTFQIREGQLFRDGLLVTINPGSPNALFASLDSSGTISRAFTVENNALVWRNSAFSNGAAYFCQVSGGGVFAVFQSPAPSNCQNQSAEFVIQLRRLDEHFTACNIVRSLLASLERRSFKLWPTQQQQPQQQLICTQCHPLVFGTYHVQQLLVEHVVFELQQFVFGTYHVQQLIIQQLLVQHFFVKLQQLLVRPYHVEYIVDFQHFIELEQLVQRLCNIDCGPSTYSFIGCAIDRKTGGLLGDSFFFPANFSQVTLENCAAACNAFNFFGAEFGLGCYCGNALNLNNNPVVAETNCNDRCFGNPAQACGAESLLQIYSGNGAAVLTPTAAYPPTPNPVLPQTAIGGNRTFTFQGCYRPRFNETDPTDNGVTVTSANDPDTQSVNNCAVFCQNSPFFYVQYGTPFKQLQ